MKSHDFNKLEITNELNNSKLLLNQQLQELYKCELVNSRTKFRYSIESREKIQKRIDHLVNEINKIDAKLLILRG